MGEIDPQEALAYGLFSRRQALAAGCSEREISRRLRRGEWTVVARGLLQLTGRLDRDGDVLLRAVLRAGPLAVASHLSAAAVLGWDLLDDPRRPQVTVPRNQSSASVPGAKIFRRNLSRDEIEHIGVLPLTSPLRTAIDIAAVESQLAAVVALDSALRLGQVTVEGLRRALAGRGCMPACPAVVAVLERVDSTSGSVWESVARCLFVSVGLPTPQCQYEVIVDGVVVARVDFAWPQARLVVEIDGFTWHSSQEALQNDHARQNRLELDGWTVLRYTAKDVRDDPGRLAAEISEALAAVRCAAAHV